MLVLLLVLVVVVVLLFVVAVVGVAVVVVVVVVVAVAVSLLVVLIVLVAVVAAVVVVVVVVVAESLGSWALEGAPVIASTSPFSPCGVSCVLLFFVFLLSFLRLIGVSRLQLDTQKRRQSPLVGRITQLVGEPIM